MGEILLEANRWLESLHAIQSDRHGMNHPARPRPVDPSIATSLPIRRSTGDWATVLVPRLGFFRHN
ncbi:hypothetical protein CH63R_02985 [Colletotrichum higginsianum IMI 349063]|uniref:Uncharacterized protein n=1 Tax=Colletotrichum higginsianum (strain IMI 349063) TaxID=759273 RepID=A0A1B7YQD4_COLHI|nr:hypothetical protein CH63R_02985 [Colletotrichum higginsianum IMI 349063]OBR14259.1 hypothetical protein CH63R_02985 [Colletotrichum higginsianum IMI 349063]